MFAWQAHAQQDRVYGFFMINKTAYNPSFTGSGKFFEATISRNQQWVGLEGSPTTTAFIAETPLRILDKKTGLGIVVHYDEMGFLRTGAAAASIATSFQLPFASLTTGMQVGFLSNSFDGSNYFYPEGQNATASSGGGDNALPTTQQAAAFDLGLGVSLARRNWKTGISITHMTSPRLDFGGESKVQLYPHLFINGEYTVALSESNSLLLQGLFSSDFGAYRAFLRGGVNFQQSLTLALSNHLFDGLGADAEITLGEQAKIGYMLRYNFATARAFSHEVYLRVNFDFQVNLKKKHKSVRYL